LIDDSRAVALAERAAASYFAVEVFGKEWKDMCRTPDESGDGIAETPVGGRGSPPR